MSYGFLQLGGRGTGIERLIQHQFGPAGYLRRGTRKMDVSGLPRDVCGMLSVICM